MTRRVPVSGVSGFSHCRMKSFHFITLLSLSPTSAVATRIGRFADGEHVTEYYKVRHQASGRYVVSPAEKLRAKFTFVRGERGDYIVTDGWSRH